MTLKLHVSLTPPLLTNVADIKDKLEKSIIADCGKQSKAVLAQTSMETFSELTKCRCEIY